MRSVLGVFWHIIMALTGALGFAALVVGAGVLACGGTAAGCAWLWRGRQRRRMSGKEPPGGG